eukprot:107600-Rhodomonas_salina.4
MQSSALVTVSLDNFLMTFFVSEVSVLFGSESVSVNRIDSTSSTRTRLAFFYPQSNGGTRTVTVQPTGTRREMLSYLTKA